jgi:hypothetical protein
MTDIPDYELDQIEQTRLSGWWLGLALFLPALALHGILPGGSRHYDVRSGVLCAADCLIALRALWAILGGERSRGWIFCAILYILQIPLVDVAFRLVFYMATQQ